MLSPPMNVGAFFKYFTQIVKKLSQKTVQRCVAPLSVHIWHVLGRTPEGFLSGLCDCVTALPTKIGMVGGRGLVCRSLGK